MDGLVAFDPIPDVDGAEILQRSSLQLYRSVLSFGSKHGVPLAVKRREFMTLLGGAAIAWAAINAQRPVGLVFAADLPKPETGSTSPAEKSIFAAPDAGCVVWTDGCRNCTK